MFYFFSHFVLNIQKATQGGFFLFISIEIAIATKFTMCIAF